MEKVIHPLAHPAPRPRLLRVAAYTRVSSGKDAMLHSLSRQISYYSQLIQMHPGWTYAGCYADADYTGTRGERPEFQRLLADCRAGKIDRVLTKSVSRFARNTVTLLETVRELKEHGIAVFFEKERLDTLSGDGELLLSFLASFAQEESRSVSENCKWRVRKDFSEGKPMNLMLLYGYRSQGGRIVIDPEEAAVVRRVFHDYTHGLGSNLIAEALLREQIPCRLCGRWSSGLIRTMLTNEKYMGDALLQKTFTVDFLTKTAKVNEGEVPQFFVENSHPGIISREVFDLVQLEMKRRKGRSRHTSARSLFSDRLVCSCCGGTFGSKVWHSNDPYRKVIWRCNRKYDRKENACPNRHLEEKEIRKAFVEAVNRLISRREKILDAAEAFSTMLAETSGLEQQLCRLAAEKEVLLRKLTAMVHENAVKEQDQEEYQRQYQEVEGELSRLDTEMEKLKTKKADRLLRRNKLRAFMGRLRASEQLAAFDEGMFLGLTETVLVYPDRLVFVFRDGTEVAV